MSISPQYPFLALHLTAHVTASEESLSVLPRPVRLHARMLLETTASTNNNFGLSTYFLDNRFLQRHWLTGLCPNIDSDQSPA